MKKIIILLLTFIIFWFAGFVLFAWHINNINNIDTTHTEAIIALTGGRNRISEAVKLLDKGLANRLFISGVNKDISLRDIQETQHLKLSKHQNIDIGHKASNTIENAYETNEWLKKNNIKSIRLVTSNYHIARSMIEFKEQNPSLIIIAHPVYSEKIEKKWWTSWQTFSLIFKEYNKLLCAYIRCKLTK